ncbi:metallopeptidase family protein [Arsenicicoccus cauae]|uniref:Metallopeptidase family protein n=1 Tax=Arsenicicoccus cauae TaxID=2663847 RepID=A0A6I3ISH5_9MICO|nr:metallopeptidase family protein [Arsenicicoccus cauae]MTB72860.1 hypothetical protein [Arsenicicoccus cauae]
MPVLVDDATFDDAVGAALDEVPVALMDLLDNVVFLVEDEPPEELGDLLGLYEGTPLTERGWGAEALLPDRIYLYRGPLSRMCDDLDHLRNEVTVTVVHEIAHHFGIDDERLHAMGWG